MKKITKQDALFKTYSWLQIRWRRSPCSQNNLIFLVWTEQVEPGPCTLQSVASYVEQSPFLLSGRRHTHTSTHPIHWLQLSHPKKVLTRNPQTGDPEACRSFHVTVHSSACWHRRRSCYCSNISTSVSTCSLCWAVPVRGPFNGLLLAACQWG